MINKILDVLRNGNDKILYQINNETITYNEALIRVKLLSDCLKKQGNGPVILYGHKSIDQFISILSCLVAKRCYIPIDLCTPVERIKEIINLSKADLIIKNELINIENIQCLALSELKELYKDNNYYFENDNNMAYIIFTSGSTGKPKGVPISYDNLNNFINWIVSLDEFKHCNNLIMLSQASFSFDLSLMDIYFSLYKNMQIVAIDGDTKDSIVTTLDIIKNSKVEFLVMTPTFVKMLLIDYNFNDINFKNIKYMFFCGECLEVETVKKIKDRFSNVKIINAYGPTEATCCVSLIEIENDMLDNKLLPVGKISTSAVKIEIDNNDIILKGQSVFDGYLSFKSENSYRNNGINCYKTGDVGYIKDDLLYCNGRIDNQIKYQGYRIELTDIENNLLRLDGIIAACVIAKYKENSNIVRLIKAFVVCSNSMTELEIKKKLEKIIPHYMIPKKIVILDKIPINENGKYDRKKLSNL